MCQPWPAAEQAAAAAAASNAMDTYTCTVTVPLLFRTRLPSARTYVQLAESAADMSAAGRPLLVGSRPPQLWPLLLSKAVLKVMAAYRSLELQLPHKVRA